MIVARGASANVKATHTHTHTHTEYKTERERERAFATAPVYLKGKFAPRDCSYRWLIDRGFFQLLPGLFSAKGSRCSRAKSRRMSAVRKGTLERPGGVAPTMNLFTGDRLVSAAYWFSFLLAPRASRGSLIFFFLKSSFSPVTCPLSSFSRESVARVYILWTIIKFSCSFLNL